MNVISDDPIIKIMYSIRHNLINNTMINPRNFKNDFYYNDNDDNDDDDITSKNPNDDCDYFYEYSRNP